MRCSRASLIAQRWRVLLSEDAESRAAMLSDRRAHDAVLADSAVLLSISPDLLFTVLLLRARDKLAETGYTLELAGSGQTAVFDGSKVSEFMHQTGMTEYLLAVLTSFVRVEHWHYRYPKPDGTFARPRVSSFDLDGLNTYCFALLEQDRSTAYRQIADRCLFVAGVSVIDIAHGWPLSVWEDRGAEFYGLAARHRQAQSTELSTTLQAPSDHFAFALKPLTLLFSYYLGFLRDRLPGV